MRVSIFIRAAVLSTFPLVAFAADPLPPTRALHPDIPAQSATSLGTATYAKILCSAVFVTAPASSNLRSAGYNVLLFNTTPTVASIRLRSS